MRQPYVVRYEAERMPFVLASNVIELGLQQAKISPLPSFSAISDILSESGIDLTGVTRSSRGGEMARSSGYPRSGQRELPRAEPGRYGSAAGHSEPRYDEPGYEQPYQGWDDIRRGDSRYP